jgi:hypothetical protein
VKIPASIFGSKYASKREVYRFCSIDCSYYLSGYDTMTVWHMRDLVASKRRAIKSNKVRHITIPQFSGLSIEELLQYATRFPKVMEALPIVQKEVKKLPRQYIGNVIFTLVGEPFRQWVLERVESRNERCTVDDGAIEMDPEIAAIFQ